MTTHDETRAQIVARLQRRLKLLEEMLGSAAEAEPEAAPARAGGERAAISGHRIGRRGSVQASRRSRARR